MFSRIRDFVTRHRRKFLVTGIVVGGAYYVIRYTQRKLIEFQERQAREFFEKTRRMQHFESTERTCNQVIIGMNTELFNMIIRECNTDNLLEQLRSNPSNKLKLWEEMKIVAFTRLVTFIYASSLLLIALRVQLNLLGGYLYRDITTDQKKITDELKQRYLSLIRHFINDGGLTELIQLIYSKVLHVLKDQPLTKTFSLTDLEQLFWSLQIAINGDSGDPVSKMSKYLMPAELAEHSDPLFKQMFNETLDLLETQDASSICSNSICRGFSLAVDAIAESLGDALLTQSQPQSNDVRDESTDAAAPSTSKMSISVDNNNSIVMNINTVQIALAKIIPIVSGLTSKGVDAAAHTQNFATSLVTFYVVLEKAKVLGANVYETFSSVD